MWKNSRKRSRDCSNWIVKNSTSARHLTLNPQEHENEDYTQTLRQQGFSDEAILDAVLVIAYFNFVNRIALSLGLKASEEEMTGYRY
jgi:hypothetical protein